MRLRFLAFVLPLLILSGFSAAQSIENSTMRDAGGLVTLKLSVSAAADDFKPSECAWYSFRQGSLNHFHTGCESFNWEFAEARHIVVLVMNGRSSKLEGNDQRSDVAVMTVQPRVAVEHTKFRPQDLADMEAAAKKKP